MAKSNLEKRWEEAGLTDDFIFSKVFLDPQITLELLRRIFPELVIKDIKVLNSQQEIKSTYDAKSVRFDIYIEDRDNNHYDIEMQVADHHNLPNETASTNLAYQQPHTLKARTTVKQIIRLLFSSVVLIPLAWANSVIRLSVALRPTPTIHTKIVSRLSSLTSLVFRKLSVQNCNVYQICQPTESLMKMMISL